MHISKPAKLRLVGALVLFFNLWLIGNYTLSGLPILLLTFGFAIGFELLVVRPATASFSATQGTGKPPVASVEPPQPLSFAKDAHNLSSIELHSESGEMKSPEAVSPASASLATTNRSDESEENLWSQALAEFDGASRRPGVWAKAFANANGNEAVAKAQYLQERVNQLLAQIQERATTAEAEHARQLLASRERVTELKAAFLAGARLSSEEIVFLAFASSSDRSLCQISDRLRGETLLHWCARYGLEVGAQTLLTNGANKAAVNGNGQRPAALARPNSLLH